MGCVCLESSRFFCVFIILMMGITPVVSIFFFLVFLSCRSVETIAIPLFYLTVSSYFLLMTIFGCVIYAGIKKKSIRLLKWPGRLLVAMIIVVLGAIISYAWVFAFVYEKESMVGHTAMTKTSFLISLIMIVLTILYFIVICKVIKTLEIPPTTETVFSTANTQMVSEFFYTNTDVIVQEDIDN